MKQTLHTCISNLSLKNKIYGISLLCIILMSAASLIGTNLTSRSNEELLYKTIAGSLSYSATDISNRLTNIQTMSSMVLSNSIIQGSLEIIKDSNDYIDRTNAYQELYRLIPDYYESFKSNNISYMTLYNDSFTVSTNQIRANETPAKIQSVLLEETAKREGAPCWISDYSSEYGFFLGRDIRRIRATRLDTIGTLLVNVNMEEMITSATNFSSQYEDASYLLLDGSDLIYHSNSLSEEEALTVQTALTSAYQVIKIKGHSYFAVRGTIPGYNWDYICLVSYNPIVTALNMSHRLYIGIIIISICISLLLSYTCILSLTHHFDTLIIKMKAFGKDESQLVDVGYDYSQRMDELGLLHRQFDKMVSKIQHLIQVNYVNELLKKEAQLKALENQINPHFLYNTLESVNWRAKAIGEPDISSMVESLGTMLRITLDKKDTDFTLGKELELVRSYMTIQQIRFEDRLSYQILTDNSLLDARLPRLTIQPLVENAISYGLEEMLDQCRILIQVQENGSDLQIYVKNNGSLFEEDLLEKLADNRIQSHGLGIGLLNINKRLKLTFGESYGLTLYNEEDLAVAMITVPFQTEKENTSYAETDNC